MGKQDYLILVSFPNLSKLIPDMFKEMYIGIDIGSVSVTLAAFVRRQITPGEIPSGFFVPPADQIPSEDGGWILSAYRRHGGDPIRAAETMYRALTEAITNGKDITLFCTGTGGKEGAERLKGTYVNEFRASAEAVSHVLPEVHTIFELGGERSRYLQISPSAEGVMINCYGVNGECAAGTGSFFDQQASRLQYDTDRVSEALDGVERAAVIAGRCSVFAKSDMIHAQQRGYSPPEVLKGLCSAVVRNFKGTVTKGKKIIPPVALIGGVAANRGVVQAVREQFELSDGHLIVPPLHSWMGAIGAVLLARNRERAAFPVIHPSESSVAHAEKPLSLEKVVLLRDQAVEAALPGTGTTDVYLGLDIGSVSTNLALIDQNGDLLDSIYCMTSGRPVEVVIDSLREMGRRVGEKVRIRGVGATGSGRELIAMLVGADCVKDEITAHKTGALHVSRKYLKRPVDTIFEIGGQDSKFISIQDGVVTDFSLNEACAAGTGSFLEEQAAELGISIKNEFARMALRSRRPLQLGERCTVFMEKELIPHLHRGTPKEDITAGLAYSVVKNYLNRVVKKRRIGEVIFFQGGTAYNDAVAAAFATLLDKEIIVPPHNGIMGAIGAALLARDRAGDGTTAFRGWDLAAVKIDNREFTCQACSNHCLIQEFGVEGEKSYWGDKCSEKYRKRSKRSQKPVSRDLFSLHDELLYRQPVPPDGKGFRIGIPRVLTFFDRLPFWLAYFRELGCLPVLSGPSKTYHVQAGIEAAVAEPCFPVQMAHGHVAELLRLELDAIFIPNLVNELDPAVSVASFICPWTQTLPLVVRQTPALQAIDASLLYPTIQFRQGPEFVARSLEQDVARKLGISSEQNSRAVRNAWEAYESFRNELMRAGDSALKEIMGSGRECILLLGRPYNLYDPGLNLNLPAKLRNIYGVDVIPMDFLPLDSVDINGVHDHMFWNYGRRILQAALLSRDYPNMHLIYLSNFKCGPDSYIRHYVQDAAAEPFLFLQLDSHANDAGLMTRVEAFLESKGM